MGGKQNLSCSITSFNWRCIITINDPINYTNISIYFYLYIYIYTWFFLCCPPVIVGNLPSFTTRNNSVAHLGLRILFLLVSFTLRRTSDFDVTCNDLGHLKCSPGWSLRHSPKKWRLPWARGCPNSWILYKGKTTKMDDNWGTPILGNLQIEQF